MRSVLLAAAALAACGYHPGSFKYPHAQALGQRATIGCLDVSVGLRQQSERGAVVAYDFANRCDHPSVVDLASVRVVGRTYDGRLVPLPAYDPHREVRALPLDGRSTGHEAIAYVAKDAPRVAQICVDAPAIAHQGGPWMCFAASPSQVAEVSR